MALALFLGLGVISGVMGGVSSAQNYCKYQQQLKDVVAQTAQIQTKSQQVLDALEAEDDSVATQIQTLQMDALAASNTLVSLRKAYVSQLQRYQLYAMMFIVITFMLLLGKKMKWL